MWPFRCNILSVIGTGWDGVAASFVSYINGTNEKVVYCVRRTMALWLFIARLCLVDLASCSLLLACPCCDSVYCGGLCSAQSIYHYTKTWRSQECIGYMPWLYWRRAHSAEAYFVFVMQQPVLRAYRKVQSVGLSYTTNSRLWWALVWRLKWSVWIVLNDGRLVSEYISKAYMLKNGSLATYLATWLILPVVICLSQRLSHACLSTHHLTMKPRMAH